MKSLDKVRSEIKALQAEERTIINAPLSTGDIEKRLDFWLTEQCGLAQEFFRRARSLAKPTQVRGGPGWSFADAAISDNPKLGVALMVFFNRDDIRQEAMRHALEAAPEESQIPLAERDDRIQRVREQVYRLGINEENLVRELEAAGQPVARRPDVDGYIVLGIPHPEFGEARSS